MQFSLIKSRHGVFYLRVFPESASGCSPRCRRERRVSLRTTDRREAMRRIAHEIGKIPFSENMHIHCMGPENNLITRYGDVTTKAPSSEMSEQCAFVFAASRFVERRYDQGYSTSAARRKPFAIDRLQKASWKASR